MPRPADLIGALVVLGVLLVLAARLNREEPAILSGPFVAVDGDTLAAGGQRLRLAGIDAPELGQSCGGAEAWPCGTRARQALAALITPDMVCRTASEDRYGRSLVACEGREGDLARLMVGAGLALSLGCCDREEEAARQARRGIWAGPLERPALWRERNPSGP